MTKILKKITPVTTVETVLHLCGLSTIVFTASLIPSLLNPDIWFQQYVFYTFFGVVLGLVMEATAFIYRFTQSDKIKLIIRQTIIFILCAAHILDYTYHYLEFAIMFGLSTVTTCMIMLFINGKNRYIIGISYFTLHAIISLILSTSSRDAIQGGMYSDNVQLFIITQILTLLLIALLIRDAAQMAVERAQKRQAVEMAAANERNRMAREIHDGLGHYLTSINAHALALVSNNGDESGASFIHQLSRDALTEARRSIATLRGEEVTDLPFIAQLRTLADTLTAAGISTQLNIYGDRQVIDSHVEHELFRITQEALNNTRKHAQAEHAKVDLQYTPRAVCLSISDDGRGADTTNGGYGILGIYERIEELRGTCEIETARGRGFRIFVEVPV